MLTQHYPLYMYVCGDLSKRSRTASNSAVRDRILPKLELIRVLLVVILTCKNEEGPIKKFNVEARVLTRLSPL